ncbi:universal stress protein [Acrocarpospora pleiomorpha]|uniref:universal stress protein n=1 Tax=Acrocarpospora pleiomorpha TaxID=90975 RepID=UPI0031D7DDFE
MVQRSLVKVTFARSSRSCRQGPIEGEPESAEETVMAGLVVVGSRGMGAFGSAVLGSVSHGVLHRASCPVAVVRPCQEER